MPYYPGDQTLPQTPFVIAPVAHPPLLRQSGVWWVIEQHTMPMVDMEQQQEHNGVDDNPDRLQWFAC